MGKIELNAGRIQNDSMPRPFDIRAVVQPMILGRAQSTPIIGYY